MFSNSVSSSAADDADFPRLVTTADNVRAQHRLLTEHFGVSSIACAYGFSMGAGQSYHWAARYFRVADNLAELEHLRRGTPTPIPSIWGHRAGNPNANGTDLEFLASHVRTFLDS